MPPNNNFMEKCYRQLLIKTHRLHPHIATFKNLGSTTAENFTLIKGSAQKTSDLGGMLGGLSYRRIALWSRIYGRFLKLFYITIYGKWPPPL